MGDPLSVLGGVASIAGLISQAIDLVQKIQKAKSRITSRGQEIIQQTCNLQTLTGYLQLVNEQPVLQTAAVAAAVQTIINVGSELQKHVDDQVRLAARSNTRQFMHNLKVGDDDKELEDILKKLDRARTWLGDNIQLVHVGLTKTSSNEIVAMMPMIRRLNRAVEKVLGLPLNVRTVLKAREDDERDDGTIVLKEVDIEALGMSDKSAEGNIVWVDNMAQDNSRQAVGIFGDVDVKYTGELRFQGNVAQNNSQQTVGPMSGDALKAFFA